MNRDVKSFYGPQNKVITFVSQSNVPFSNDRHPERHAQRVSSHTECAPVRQENEKFGPSEGFSKTSEVSSVVAARGSS